MTGAFHHTESKRLAVGYTCISEHWSGECLCFRSFNPSMLALKLPLGHDLASVMCANDQSCGMYTQSVRQSSPVAGVWWTG